MKYDLETVQAYLILINDSNPIHDEIVPGQLVCEWLLNDVVWYKYKVQYKNPIKINEPLIKEINKDKIVCMNEDGTVKIVVSRVE